MKETPPGSIALVLLLFAAACGPEAPPAPEEVPAPEASTPDPAPEGAGLDHTDLDDAWRTAAPNANRPLPNLITAGQPTPEQLAAARDLGVRTVINLRPDHEPGTKAADSEALGLTYVSLPIRGAEDLTTENAERLAELLASAEGDVLLHCGSSNRVGALLAVKAHRLEGRSVEEALELGRAAGLTKMEPAVREILEAPQ